jgi:uncharacterized protein
VPIRAVLDTNIWISALSSDGTARAIADALDADQFILISANELVGELVGVVQRPKFAETMATEHVQRIVSMVEEKAIFVHLGEIPAISRDPKDDMFLACAAESEADYLVTGDTKHLLPLREYGKTQIIAARQFLDILMTND